MTAPATTSSLFNAQPVRLDVVIVGGGIGGLPLAQGLKKSGVRVAVYERDRTACKAIRFTSIRSAAGRCMISRRDCSSLSQAPAANPRKAFVSSPSG